MRESLGLHVGQMQVGDMLVMKNGFEEIFSIDCVMTGGIIVYDFGIDGTKTFYAYGYLTHNVDWQIIGDFFVDKVYATKVILNT